MLFEKIELGKPMSLAKKKFASLIAMTMIKSRRV